MSEEKKPMNHEPIELTYLQKAIFGEYMEPNETVFYIIQTHWWIFFVELFKLSLLFIPSLIVLLFYRENDYVYLASLTATLVTFSLLLVSWYNLYADAFILTDKNIIFVEWDSIVKIKSSRISYTEIESASVEMEGFMSTILGFGDLKIETANETFSPMVRGATHASRAEQQILINKEYYTKDDQSLEAEIFKKALRQIMDEYRAEDQKVSRPEEDLSKRFEKNRIRHKADGIRHKVQGINDSAEIINVNEQTIKTDKKDNSRFNKYRLKEDDKIS